MLPLPEATLRLIVTRELLEAQKPVLPLRSERQLSIEARTVPVLVWMLMPALPLFLVMVSLMKM